MSLSYLSEDETMKRLPQNLATAASANLAREDATIGRFNDVAHNIRVPAPVAADTAPVVQPVQPEPVAQPVVADQGMVDRFHALQSALSTGVDPDAPARFIRPQRRAEILKESAVLGDQVHQSALEQAAQAHENLIRQRDIETATATAKLANDIAAIKHPVGTAEHGTALEQAIIGNLGAMDSERGRTLADIAIKHHDRAQSRLEHIANLNAANIPPIVPPGFEATMEHAGPGGISYNIKPTVAASEGADQYVNSPEGRAQLAKDFPNAKVTTDPKTGALVPFDPKLPETAFVKHAAAKANVAILEEAAAKERADNMKKNLENVPFSKSAELAAAQGLKEDLESRYPELKAPLTKATKVRKYNPETGKIE